MASPHSGCDTRGYNQRKIVLIPLRLKSPAASRIFLMRSRTGITSESAIRKSPNATLRNGTWRFPPELIVSPSLLTRKKVYWKKCFHSAHRSTKDERGKTHSFPPIILMNTEKPDAVHFVGRTQTGNAYSNIFIIIELLH